MRIVIAGMGVAGGVIAAGLAQLPGIELVCVEQVARDDHALAGNGLNIGPNALTALKAALPAVAGALQEVSLPWRAWRALRATDQRHQRAARRQGGTALWGDMLIDQFDEMLRQSEHEPLVFNLSLHPFLVGHAFRLKHLRRAVMHIAARREWVWMARAGEIAAHVTGLPAGVVA